MFLQKNNSRGFTLIELLVVIAIIGILSSVVLASLNSARNKANDAAVKANLNNLRAQAAIYYDDSSGYYSTGTYTFPLVSTICGSANSFFANGTVVGAVAAVTTAGGTPTCYLGGTAGAGNRADKWAISAPLKTGGSWCVDYTGWSKAGTAQTTGVCA